MSELEQNLASLLGDPQKLQQLLSMVQALGIQPPAPQSPGQAVPPPSPPPASSSPQPSPAAPPPPPIPAGLDPAMLQRLAGMAAQGRVDANQQALLRALHPYLSRDRVGKLERAMQAAKMANVASAFLSAGGLELLSGR